jgi:hypothetical protein
MVTHPTDGVHSSQHVRSRNPLFSRAALITVAIFVAITFDTHAAVFPVRSCEIAIEMSATVPLRWTHEDLQRFRDAAGRVWIAHGADLCWRDADTPCSAAPTTLYVRLAEDVPATTPAEGADVIGWIGFSDRMGPGPFIVLSVKRAIRLLERVEFGGRRLLELPAIVECLLPQALGRVLAHELGHYLLARRAHSATGVMRASVRPLELADEAAGVSGQLARSDAGALAMRCAPSSLGVADIAAPSARR